MHTHASSSPCPRWTPSSRRTARAPPPASEAAGRIDEFRGPSLTHASVLPKGARLLGPASRMSTPSFPASLPRRSRTSPLSLPSRPRQPLSPRLAPAPAPHDVRPPRPPTLRTPRLEPSRPPLPPKRNSVPRQDGCLHARRRPGRWRQGRHAGQGQGRTARPRERTSATSPLPRRGRLPAVDGLARRSTSNAPQWAESRADASSRSTLARPLARSDANRR